MDNLMDTIDLPNGPPLPLTMDVILDPPLSLGTKEYTVIHLEEPTGQQLWKAEGERARDQNPQTNTAFMLTLISLVSDTPRQVVDKMRLSQINDCARFLSRFIGAGL